MIGSEDKLFLPLKLYNLRSLPPVTPVKTGAQGNRQDLATGNAVKPAMHRALPWAPASLGGDGKGAGDDGLQMKMS